MMNSKEICAAMMNHDRVRVITRDGTDFVAYITGMIYRRGEGKPSLSVEISSPSGNTVYVELPANLYVFEEAAS